MAEKESNEGLKQFKKIVKQRLQEVLNNTRELDITKADRKFLQLYQIACKKDMGNNNPGFRDIYNQAVKIFDQHYNKRLETIKNLKKLENKRRVDDEEQTERDPKKYSPLEKQSALGYW